MSGLSVAPVDVLAAIAAAKNKAVGTYMLASTSQGDFGNGTLRSGSQLRPAGHRVGGSGAYYTVLFETALTGTWRAMGRAPGQVGTYEGVTLWKREV